MEGLIFIPDISGFTDFVKKTDHDLGATVMHELLSAIIESNPLELEISEIEGDAILFYKIGQPIALNNVFIAFNSMYEAFNKKYTDLCLQYKIKPELSLKFILHYGEMSVYYIKGFKKLYGQMIIESHRLLKNGAGNSNYILITEDYMQAVRNSSGSFHIGLVNYTNYSSQLFTDLREISYYFFNYPGAEPNSFNRTMQNILA